MKNKHLVLLTILSALCFVGCSKAKGQPQGDSTGSYDLPASSEDIVEVVPGAPVVSVNQESVTICVGESYTLKASAENIDEPVFVWSIDGDSSLDVVSVAQMGNTAVITALAEGQTKLVASVERDGHVYFKTVQVTVKQDSEVSLVVSENIGFNQNGYKVDLSTLSTENGDVTNVLATLTAYKNNKIAIAKNIRWESQDTSIAAVEGNTFRSVSEGQTKIIGSCEVDGKPYSVEIAVNVYRPTIVLDESFVVEVENLASFELASDIKGVSRGVTYNGASVGSFDVQKKLVTLQKSALPTTAADMGENCPFFVETNLAKYEISVALYTKILYTKEDFDSFATLSKQACSDNAAIWDGYFVLGEDIAYNGLFQSKVADIDSLWAAVEGNWSNGGLYGFRGVFDGKGHKIEGISIDNGSQIASIFGVLHIDGVIKNISFTSASVAANSGLICSAGGGTIENIYIQYASMGKGTQHYEGDGSINNHCGSFFSFKEPTSTANVSNCVIDVSQALFNANVSIKIVGSEYVTIKNVFVIGGTDELRAKSNATLSFSSMLEFVQSTNAQSRYKKFSEDFWSQASGVAVSNAVYKDVCDLEASFTQTIDFLVSGTSYNLKLSNPYVSIASNSEKLSFHAGVVTVAETVEDGEQVTITATSLFNPNKTASFNCSLKSVDFANCEDLSKDGTVFYDVTLDKVYFAELSEKIEEEILYFTNADRTAIIYGKDGDEAKSIIAVSANKFYKLRCLSVTKVLEKAEDLHYIRRDYTVSSYGNNGCYDGRITGTFVMINDIDCTGLTLKDSGNYWENSRGFGGTFDGRGYTISNLSVSKNGLFGAVAYATIKNVNFTGVCLKPDDQGAYVALFASRIFNTTIENVSMEFVEYVAGTDVYHTSGLMVYETSFDNVFKDLTIDISKVSGVAYLTESRYDADLPYKSEKKSTYENIIVIVANMDEIPQFAFKQANGGEEDVVLCPPEITFQVATA